MTRQELISHYKNQLYEAERDLFKCRERSCAEDTAKQLITYWKRRLAKINGGKIY